MRRCDPQCWEIAEKPSLSTRQSRPWSSGTRPELLDLQIRARADVNEGQPTQAPIHTRTAHTLSPVNTQTHTASMSGGKNRGRARRFFSK